MARSVASQLVGTNTIIMFVLTTTPVPLCYDVLYLVFYSRHQAQAVSETVKSCSASTVKSHVAGCGKIFHLK
ncbi:hypothetical protein EJ08DRAFT_647431 [Tothia fuscella]|uniref:Uncharacterized protein n=1 Tax=Tothia fuscella TaxID=1048955 RepID=A0A9P4NXY1_9PEZI|nr:hypothetical protein EJ08DRAFT_647431 [Tothia fuscella]